MKQSFKREELVSQLSLSHGMWWHVMADHGCHRYNLSYVALSIALPHQCETWVGRLGSKGRSVPLQLPDLVLGTQQSEVNTGRIHTCYRFIQRQMVSNNIRKNQKDSNSSFISWLYNQHFYSCYAPACWGWILRLSDFSLYFLQLA